MVLQAFASSYPKLYLLIVVIASILIMLQSSRMLLHGITGWAKKLGLSDYLVGLFVIAIVASFPELVLSFLFPYRGASIIPRRRVGETWYKSSCSRRFL